MIDDNLRLALDLTRALGAGVVAGLIAYEPNPILIGLAVAVAVLIIRIEIALLHDKLNDLRETQP